MNKVKSEYEINLYTENEVNLPNGFGGARKHTHRQTDRQTDRQTSYQYYKIVESIKAHNYFKSSSLVSEVEMRLFEYITDSTLNVYNVM